MLLTYIRSVLNNMNRSISISNREFIDNEVVKFSTDNPQTAVYVRFRPGRHPRLVGEYCEAKKFVGLKLYMCVSSSLVNGNSQVVPVPNLSSSEVKGHVGRLSTASGVKVQKLKKYMHTDNPSIQGNWTPFLHK